MYKRVFKQKGSRVFRVRYRWSDGPRIYDEPLNRRLSEVDEFKARQLIEEREKGIVWRLGPQPLREASPIDLKQRGKDFGYISSRCGIPARVCWHRWGF